MFTVKSKKNFSMKQELFENYRLKFCTQQKAVIKHPNILLYKIKYFICVLLNDYYNYLKAASAA